MELEDTMYSPPLSGTKGSLTGVEWPRALILKDQHVDVVRAMSMHGMATTVPCEKLGTWT